MSIYCINPGVYQGDPSGAPEFASNNETECAKCRTYVDLDDEAHTEMTDGSILCAECREVCAVCGYFIADYSISVVLRCPTTGRKERWCIQCAASDWLDRLLEFKADALVDFDPLSAAHVRSIDVETLDRGAIDALVEFYWRR